MKHRNHTLHAVIAAALLAGAPLAFAHSAQQTPPSNTGSEPMMHQQQDQSDSQMQNHQDRMQNNNMQDKSMQHDNMHDNSNMQSNSKMMGWHSMPGKVTSVNHQTGIVKVKTEGKNLRVHFPPKTITSLKKGDKISLDLGYKMSSSGDHMGHM